MHRSEEIIPTCSDGLDTRIALNAAFTALFGVGVTILFNTALGFGTRVETLILWILWICLPLLWGISTWVIKSAQKKTTYTLASDSLVVRKVGLFGIREQYYRYDFIVAVAVRRAGLFTRADYGTISLHMQRQPASVQLDFVKNPEHYAQQIRRLMTLRSHTPPLQP